MVPVSGLSPLHPDLVALLSACRAAPADDVPRLVLADWLDDNADSAGLTSADDARDRAELIRVQVELARPSCDTARITELRAAEARLLSRNAAVWLGDLPRRLDQLRARQPFGYAARVPGAPQPAYVFDPLASSNPWKFTRGLLTVDLYPPELTDSELGAWFASPLAAWVEEAGVDISGLRELEQLSATAVMRPYLGVRYVLGAPPRPRMGLIQPQTEALTTRRLKRLLRSDNFGLVRSLTIYPSANEAGVMPLLPEAKIGGVRRLAIRAHIGDTGAAFLAVAPLTNLSALEVIDCKIEPGGFKLLANSEHFGQLVSLTAYRNLLCDEGLIALLASRLADRLNVLEIQNTCVKDRGVAALAASPLLDRLLGPRLNLSMNLFSDAGAEALAASPYLEAFTELILRDCRIGDRGAKALAESPSVVNLAYFDLWKNRVGDAGARALAESPHLGNVRELSLRDNVITAKGRGILEKRFGDRVRV